MLLGKYCIFQNLYIRSRGGALAMSRYDTTGTYFEQLAQNYTVLDKFFHSAFGGSFLNHQWLISATTPQWTDAPPSIFAYFIPFVLIYLELSMKMDS
jgi:phospholipase C